MRILITGASGNIGTAVLRRLAADGGHEVVGLARRPPPSGSPYAAVEWACADLSEPASVDVLRTAMTGADAVVHLAWGFQPSHDVAYLERLGVGGTQRVLEAAQSSGVGHLVHMSSIGAYSHRTSDERVDESWPTAGITSSPYSRHKAAAERLLDVQELAPDNHLRVARLRPGIIGQRSAASAMMRYLLPALVPSAALRHLPVLPLDRRLVVPVVHTDDVADAVVRVLDQGATGAFNLATEPVVTRDLIAEVLGARGVQLPAAVLRAAVILSWHARLQPVDAGWLDLAFSVPLMDTGRARRELEWTPTVGARDVLAEVVGGMVDAASDRTPVLRTRTVAEQVTRLLRHGPASERRLS